MQSQERLLLGAWVYACQHLYILNESGAATVSPFEWMICQGDSVEEVYTN